MIIDKYGRAYTHDLKEAYKYRVRTAEKFKPQGAYMFEHLFIKDKNSGVYVLPACLGRQHDINPKEIKFDITDLIFRDWQKEFIDEVDRVYSNGNKTIFCISETATGKSYAIFGTVLYFKRPTVIVVPNKSIVKGLFEKFGNVCDMKIMASGQIEKTEKLPDILVVTTASFNKQYDKINDYYSILLLDEIHQLPKRRIEQVNKWKGLFIAGYTATPQRKNFGLDGFKMIFDNTFYSKSKSLKEKIITYFYEHDYTIGDYEKASEGLAPGSPHIMRNLIIHNYERTKLLEQILKDLYNKGFKKIMVFTDRKDHIKNIKEIVQGFNFIEMSGGVDMDEAINKTKELNEYVILGMTACVKEGLDINDLEIGIMFISTSRVNAIVQAIGRMKRGYGAKDTAYMIDFVDTIGLEGVKKKRPGYYDRKKIYNENNYDIVSYQSFINN